MIHPSPTTKIDPAIARGVLAANVPASTKEAAHIVVTFLNTNYEMHLIPTTPITTPIGKRILGTIKLQAKRIDTVGTGGQYIEPVYGRPRRVQGTVLRVENGAIIIDAGVPIHATLTDARQSLDQFQPGQFVSFDAVAGATFTPAS
jgi:hypothetical protein